MSIYISTDLILNPPSSLYDTRAPRIGWHTLVAEGNVSASESESGYPVRNVAIPITGSDLYWRGGVSSQQIIEADFSVAAPINYIAIARHNLGDITAEMTVEYDDGTNWVAVDNPITPNTNHAIIAEFEEVLTRGLRLRLENCNAPPEISVWYAGEILRVERPIYVGHTPFPFAKVPSVSTGFSENGEFLGRIKRREMYEESMSFSNITPNWMRSHAKPFFDASETRPFFIAWRPSEYPAEVGYVWTRGYPSAENSSPNGRMSFNFSYQGIR